MGFCSKLVASKSFRPRAEPLWPGSNTGIGSCAPTHATMYIIIYRNISYYIILEAINLISRFP